MNSFKYYIATTLLLLALVATGCKKGEEGAPTPPTPQPQPSTTLVVKQVDGTELKEGTTLAATVGATLTLTIEMPNDAYTATVSPAMARQAVTVHKDGRRVTLKVNQQSTVATQLVITYQSGTIRINLAISTPAPTSRLQGSYNAQGRQVLAAGYAAREANFVWLAESIARMKTQYVTISTPQPLATLAEGQMVTITSKGIDDVKLQGAFRVRIVGDIYELSDGTYTLVIVKS